MGQTQGKASLQDAVLPFINLTDDAIGAAWQKFNIIADNWGLTEGQFVQICCAVAGELDKSPESVQPLARTFFGVLDTDANGSVDALEALATLCMVSGMEEEGKLKFVFNCYDFSEGKEVTVDEMTLAIKSTLTGLAKVAKFELPSLSAMEVVSKAAFRHAGIDAETGKLTHEAFVTYCSRSPDVSSWINFFEDCADTAQEKGGPPEDEELMEEGTDPRRSAAQEAQNADEGDDVDTSGEATADMAWAQLVGQEGSTPTEPPASNAAIPDVNADLKWVHGYRAADTRNNLRYTGDGQICYHAAGVGIVYTAAGWTDPAGGEEAVATEKAAQRFNTDHTDDIIALAMHPSGKFVATGEMGNSPKIVVWDTATMQSVQIISGFHKLAVQHLEFSPSGNLLASVGQDADNSVAIYEWASKKKVFSSKVDKNKLLDCRWGSESNFGVCGVKSMWFFKKGKKGGYKKSKGLFGQKGKIQAVLSLAAIGDENQMVSGSGGGELYVWTGRNCTKSVKAHDKSVNSLYYSAANKLLVSGGKDGHVKVWSRILKLQQDFNIHDCAVPPAIEGVKPASRPSIMDSVRSVCLSEDATKILVGTRGCEIFEISATTGTNTNMPPDQTADVGSVLVSGHYRDELWGLAIHPSKPEYATVGDDKFVRIWSMEDNKCIKKTELENMGRAIAYSPDGKSIAVGLGGVVAGGRNKKNRLNGALKVLSEDDLSISGEASDSKEPVTDVKFSGDGKTLALASADGAVYLYNAADWTVKAKCEGAQGGVTHVDFTKDGAAIMVNTEGNELLYFDAGSGEANHKGNEELKDVEWNTSTCPLSWPVQGIHSPLVDGTQYNAVHKSTGGKLLATANGFGKVKLFNYPCLDSSSGFTEYRGHSSHVTNVRFNNDDSKLITLGGNDRCIFQWDLDIDAEEEDGEEPEVPDPNAEEEAPVEDEEDEDGAEKIPEEEPDSDPEEDYKDGAEVERDEILEKHNSDDLEDLFGLEEATTGDEFMAVKPWQGAIVAPSAAKTPKVDKSVPNDSLELEWVHGYRAQDTRSNLFYNEEGEICYTAAAVGITLNKKQWVQKHNLDHTDDIISLAMSRCGKYCATGQMGKRPLIIVWDSSTGETISTIKCGRIRAVSQLAFSNDGKYLAAVGQDDNHTVTVYNWRDNAKVCTAKGDKNKCMCVSWSPDDRSLVTCGVKYYRVYTMNGRNMKAKKGLFGKACKIQPLLSIGWLTTGGGEEPAVHTCVMGAKDGTLCKVDPNEDGTCGRKIGDVVEAGEENGHKGSVHSIYTIGMDTPKDGEEDSPFKGGIVTGGQDGRVICWDSSLGKVLDGDKECFFNLAEKRDDGPEKGTYKMAPKCFKRIIRSVCMNKDCTKVLVGTKGSEIYEFSARADFGRNLNDGPLIQAHCKDELWGLAMHPTKPEYCTVGDDKTVRVWDLNTRRLIKMQKLDEMCRAVCYSPDGSLIAVGQGGSVGRGKRKKDGAFKVLNESDLSSLYEGHESHEWIQDVKFSPDGNTLAIGSHDNIIYMHSCADWSVKAKCEAHNSYITHFDFSADSQWLKSTCGAYELLYFDANTAAQEGSATKVKDVDWSSQTCTLGWPVQGIWPPCADGTDINAVDRSGNGKLLCTADDFGKVKLFNYPVLDKDAGFLVFRGHSSHVTNVRFSLGDTHVITTGGNDRCVFQWKREAEEEEDDSVNAGAKGVAR
jgi:microtubule-associated protein-like 6